MFVFAGFLLWVGAKTHSSSSIAYDFEQLRTEGYQVIPSVFTPEECDTYVGRLWDVLEDLACRRLKRDDPETWINENWPNNIHYICQHNRLGHCQPLWDIRSDPRVVDVFSQLHGVAPNNLLTSFDGMCVMRPPELMRGGGYASGSPHTDHSPLRKEAVYQSFINLEDARECDGCLTVYPRSHLYHAEVVKKIIGHDAARLKNDWHILTPEAETLLKDYGSEPLRVAAPKGSMVIWNKAFHHSTAPMRNRPAREGPAPYPFRWVVYVCQTPRAWARRDVLAKKIKAFEQLRMTNHLAHEVRLFSAKPRTYGHERVLCERADGDLPMLTPLGRRLVGYEI